MIVKKATEVDFLFSASLGSAFSSEAINELYKFYNEISEGDDLDFDDLVKEILSDWVEYTETSLRSNYDTEIAELVDDDPNVILTVSQETDILLKHLEGKTNVIRMVNTSHFGGYPVDYLTFLVKESLTFLVKESQ